MKYLPINSKCQMFFRCCVCAHLAGAVGARLLELVGTGICAKLLHSTVALHATLAISALDPTTTTLHAILQ
jgi:hypothetical protein